MVKFSTYNCVEERLVEVYVRKSRREANSDEATRVTEIQLTHTLLSPHR